jgi:hypothetical protein
VKISIRQVLASVAGAVVAATIASFFGVSGTIVGVAIGSAAATIGTAVVAQSIDRTHTAVRQAVVRAPDASLLRRLGGTNVAGAVTESVPEASAPVTEAVRSNEVRGDEVPVTEITSPGPRTAVVPEVETPPEATRQLNWRVVAVTSLIVFVVVLAVITLVELGAGKPLADLFGGSPGNGTSIFGGTTNTTQPPSTTTTVPSTSRPSTTGGSTTSTTAGSTTTTTTTSVPTTTTTGPTASTPTSTTPPGASG